MPKCDFNKVTKKPILKNRKLALSKRDKEKYRTEN